MFVNRTKSPEAEKTTFFEIFFSVAHLPIETFLLLPKFHIFIRLEKSWGNKQNFNFRLKTTPQAKKMTFFESFSSVAHLPIEKKLFCFCQNFISSAVQRNHGRGGKQNVNFRLKMTPQAEKMTFFGFVFCCTSTHRDETLLFLPKFHIFSRLEKLWVGKITLRQRQQQTTNDKKTKNEHHGDHNAPSGFF